MNIAWVARDGYIDLFPKIIEKLQENNVKFKPFILAHTENDRDYLQSKYGYKDVTVLAEKVNTQLHQLKNSSINLQELAKKFDAVPMIRCLWSSMFELDISHDELHRQAVAHIHFWYSCLTDNNIDILIYERPSILSSCMAWLVCQHLGIECLDFVDTAVDTMTITNNWRGDYAERLRETLENLHIDEASQTYIQAKEYLSLMQEKPKKTHDALLAGKITNYRGTITLARLRKLLTYLKRRKKESQYFIYKKALYSILWKHLRYWLVYKTHKFINVFDKNLNPEKDDYILFPLHMKGEWSNHIFMRLHYSDPLNTVKYIAQCLPSGYKLYVKEHYSMFAERTFSFYRALKRFENVVLVPPEADTFHLIKHSKAICTMGSTLGFEAILMDKPVILLGEPWYREFPGVYLVNTVYDIAKFMQEHDSLHVPTDAEKLQLIYALFDISFTAVKAPREGYLTDQNINNFAKAFGNYLSAYSKKRAYEMRQQHVVFA